MLNYFFLHKIKIQFRNHFLRSAFQSRGNSHSSNLISDISEDFQMIFQTVNHYHLIKMKLRPSFTHHYVFLNLYTFFVACKMLSILRHCIFMFEKTHFHVWRLSNPNISFCGQWKKEQVIQVCKNTFPLTERQVVATEQHEVYNSDGECWLLSSRVSAGLLS